MNRFVGLSEKEEEDYDRDLRTVFVTQIHMKADEREVFEFFSKAGRVSDVRLIKDQRTRRSKGCVEFFSCVLNALLLSLTLPAAFPESGMWRWQNTKT